MLWLGGLFCRLYKKRLNPPIDQFPINSGYDQQCERAECRQLGNGWLLATK